MADLKAAGAKGVAAWIWVAGAAVAAAGVGGVAYVASRPDVPAEVAAEGSAPATKADPAKTAEAAAAPQTEAVPTDATSPEAVQTGAVQTGAVQTEAAGPAAAAPAAGAPAPPAFDTVRAESDGSVLVAGRAGAGQSVSILSEGTVVGSAVADAGGNFAAFLTLPPSSAPRTLSLSAKGADGQAAASDQTVILQPTAPEVVVAEVAPAATAPATEPATPAPTVTAAATTKGDKAEGTGTAVAEPAGTTTGSADTGVADSSPKAAPEAAPKPADVLVADATGVRKLAPGASDTVVIDTISYNATGDVILEGRGVGAGTGQVLLYLDNASTGAAPIGADGGWKAVIAGIAPGVYTLRADEVDASGKVTSRFETPFQREAPEVIAQATTPPAPLATSTDASEASAPATNATQVPAGTATTAVPETQAAATSAADEAAAAPVSTGASAPATVAAPAPTPAATPSAPEPPKATIVTVQPGFTLWRIARESYGDGVLYVRVFEANKNLIRNPDLIYPGQVFTVPSAEKQP